MVGMFFKNDGEIYEILESNFTFERFNQVSKYEMAVFVYKGKDRKYSYVEEIQNVTLVSKEYVIKHQPELLV